MTAKITGFVTRADAGLRAPKSVSKNITPANGGVALHYGGPASNLGEHPTCVRLWKQWQTFHMDSRGWADIAYTMGVCNHGYAFAGRGAGVRTAAQGTNDGNQRYYAVVWLGGSGEKPTQAALDAFDWAVLNLRKSGAGTDVRPHSSFHSTSCPGPEVTAHVKLIDDKDISSEAKGDRWLGLHNPPMRGQDVTNVQNALVKALVLHPDGVDGIYGRATADAVNAFHGNEGIKERGCGPETWAALRKVVHHG